MITVDTRETEVPLCPDKVNCRKFHLLLGRECCPESYLLDCDSEIVDSAFDGEAYVYLIPQREDVSPGLSGF